MGATRGLKLSVLDEAFDEKDRTEINSIITELRRSYTNRLDEATLEFHRAQRAVNRASHEITRLEKHLERIEGFIEKHHITIKEK